MTLMLSVFTNDCVMELATTGQRWDGHVQAAEFYRLFLSSFEGMEWTPQALVIGPQGVLDVVNMTGKLIKEFAGLKRVGTRVHLQWVIYFPWVPEAGKFKGEVIYSIRQLNNGVLDRKNICPRELAGAQERFNSRARRRTARPWPTSRCRPRSFACSHPASRAARHRQGWQCAP